MLKYEKFVCESDVCDFVNNNNVKVISISPIEGGKAWIECWTVFYFED